MKKKKINYTYAVGRRKEASARIRLFKGEDQNMVNGIVIGSYFPGEAMRSKWLKPFEITQTVGKYFVTAKVVGGGKKGQLDAFVLGVSRALSLAKPEKFRGLLKKQGLLKVDARVRERRKVGMGGKARRKKQSPKR